MIFPEFDQSFIVIPYFPDSFVIQVCPLDAVDIVRRIITVVNYVSVLIHFGP